MFFDLFQVLYPIDKQIYKSEHSTKNKINDIFQRLLQEWDITKKEQINDLLKLKADQKLDVRRNREYKVGIIKDCVLNTQVVEDQ